ncbi:MAG: hypothetical protein ACO1OQ_02095 [Rufibacter sp.]
MGQIKFLTFMTVAKKNALRPVCLCLVLLASCAGLVSCEANQDMPEPKDTTHYLSFHKAQLGDIDSAYAEFSHAEKMGKRSFKVVGDSLKVSLEGLTGVFMAEIRVHTAAPAHENRSAQARYAYKTTAFFNFKETGIQSKVIPSPGVAPGNLMGEPWSEFYVYKTSKLQWWVPKDPCSPYVEVLTNTYDYLHCDRIYKQNGQRTAGETMQTTSCRPGWPFIVEVAFPDVNLACPNYDEAETMLIAMNQATGAEEILIHTW